MKLLTVVDLFLVFAFAFMAFSYFTGIVPAEARTAGTMALTLSILFLAKVVNSYEGEK